MESGERRRDYPSIHVSLFPLSIQTHHSPGHQRRFPLLSFFIHALLHPFISSQSPSAPNSPPQEKDAETTFHHIHHGEMGRALGSSFTPSASCDSILAQFTHPSPPPLFHVNPIHPPLPSSGHLSIHLLLLLLLYVLHGSSLFASHGVCGFQEYNGSSGGLQEHLCGID